MDLSEIKIGKFTTELATHLDKYRNVKVIILNNCELTSLENLPKWDLVVVDASENKYSSIYLGWMLLRFRFLRDTKI